MVTTEQQQDSADTRAWQAEAERWRGEAERWRVQAQRAAEVNTALLQRVTELEGQVGALAEKVATYARMLFGDSSEQSRQKKKPVPEPGQGEAGQGPERRGRGQRRDSQGHGRRDYSDLDTEEQVHDLPPEQRTCPMCGTGYQPFGEECCEQIDWRVRLVRSCTAARPTGGPAAAGSGG